MFFGCLTIAINGFSMVFDFSTIAFNGFRWFRTIGQTMRWFRWIVMVYRGCLVGKYYTWMENITFVPEENSSKLSDDLLPEYETVSAGFSNIRRSLWRKETNIV